MKGRTIRRMAIKAMIFARKAVPYALAALSAAGTIAVTVEAVKEIKKTKDPVIYLKEGEDLPENIKITEETAVFKGTSFEIAKDKIKWFFKDYWKPISLGVGSIACQTGSVFIFTKRQQQLIIATHQLESLLHRYTQAATATAAIGGTAVVNKLAPAEPPSPELTNDIYDNGKVLFWDPIFNYYFEVTELQFTSACYQVTVDFSKSGMVPISQFYYYLGVPSPVDEDENGYLGWGWFVDEESYWHDFYGEESGFIGISYSPVKVMDDGLEYREVEYYHAPMFNMNGRMLDGNGNYFYDLKWLYG